MSELSLPEKTMILSVAAWELTFCEEARGWPGQWTIVWRAEEFHGKIGTFIKSKAKPTPRKIQNALKKELLERMRSPKRCDAKRVAYLWLQKKGTALPIETGNVCKILQDALYDMDAKIAGEFFSSEPPRLFTATSHGWILGELAEIRCLASYLTRAMERASP